MSAALFETVLCWLMLAIAGWFGWQLLRQNGRFALRLEAMEERLAQLAPTVAGTESADAKLKQPGLRPAPGDGAKQGLPVGSPAPDFELPDLAGVTHSLPEYRGRRLLLIFFNAQCDYCLDIAQQLAELPVDGDRGAPLPVILVNGTRAENQAMVQEFGLTCPVLLQTRGEIASLYLADGTPNGYLVDEEGKIASSKAVGGPAILALAPQPGMTGGPAGDQNRDSLRSPRLARQAWNLAQAMVEFAADGAMTLSHEQYSRRLEICDQCDKRRGSRCTECGCFLKIKARGRAFKCPAGKWPEVGA
jgi:peroxiredoxin